MIRHKRFLDLMKLGFKIEIRLLYQSKVRIRIMKYHMYNEIAERKEYFVSLQEIEENEAALDEILNQIYESYPLSPMDIILAENAHHWKRELRTHSTAKKEKIEREMYKKIAEEQKKIKKKR